VERTARSVPTSTYNHPEREHRSGRALVARSPSIALTARMMRMPRLWKYRQLSNCHHHALREWLLALKRADLAGLTHRRYSCVMRPLRFPLTSDWTGAAIIVKCSRTKTCIVTRPRTSTRPMPSSLAGDLGNHGGSVPVAGADGSEA
jgi:hypothetical protein